MSKVLLVVMLPLMLVTTVFGDSRVRLQEGARPRQTRLSTSSDTTCAVLDDGTVRCWGANSQGQAGDGILTSPKSTPVPVSGLHNIVSVAVGYNHACALVANGAVMCWGGNEYGQLGNGTVNTSDVPVQVQGVSNVLAIAAGNRFTCALLVDGTVWCWGHNDHFQLGNAAPGPFAMNPVAASVGGTATAITAGGFHACALVVGGGARCWGYNGNGQVGDGTTAQRSSGVAVAGLANATDISAGNLHTCALLVEGNAVCWGANQSGQLGDGTQTQRPTLVQTVDHFVSGSPVYLAGVTAISAGGGHSCALLADGSARCWGDQSHGELGDGVVGATLRSTASISVSGLANSLDIVTGADHTCATEVVKGITRCWGDNTFGQIGNGSTLLVPAPQAASGVAGSIGAREVRTGSFSTCARRGTGVVACWGAVGALTTSPNGYHSHDPISTLQGIVNGTPATLPQDAIGLGSSSLSSHTCAVLSNGKAICWGENAYGQLGGGFKNDQSEPLPVAVANLSSITAISAGSYKSSIDDGHTCALLADSTVHCWGANGSGQLGDGTTTDSLTPVLVRINLKAELTGVAMISAGLYYTCALTASGDVYCWGDDTYGQLGNALVGFSSSFASKVQGVSGAIAISAGAESACALLAGGSVKCWGSLIAGDGFSYPNYPTATAISGLANAVAVSVGLNDWFTVLADGSADSWGDGDGGRLAGEFTLTSDTSTSYGFCPGAPFCGVRVNPAPVYAGFVTVQNVLIPIRLSWITAISGANSHTCSLHAFGGVSCWGDDEPGEIGNGTSAVAIYQPTAADSFTANIVPAVTLAPSGRTTEVTALMNCQSGESHILLTVVQDSVSGSSETTVQCTGGLDEVPMLIPATGPQRFVPGPATAHVEAIVKNNGFIIEDQHWTRAVVLAFP